MSKKKVDPSDIAMGIVEYNLISALSELITSITWLLLQMFAMFCWYIIKGTFFLAKWSIIGIPYGIHKLVLLYQEKKEEKQKALQRIEHEKQRKEAYERWQQREMAKFKEENEKIRLEKEHRAACHSKAKEVISKYIFHDPIITTVEEDKQRISQIDPNSYLLPDQRIIFLNEDLTKIEEVKDFRDEPLETLLNYMKSLGAICRKDGVILYKEEFIPWTKEIEGKV